MLVFATFSFNPKYSSAYSLLFEGRIIRCPAKVVTLRITSSHHGLRHFLDKEKYLKRIVVLCWWTAVRGTVKICLFKYF